MTVEGDRRRIVVAGPCASGKTTLVAGLRAAGLEAYTVGQEHSIIKDLWARRDPDVVITLDLPLDEVRARRGAHWSAAIYAVQHQRLQNVFAASDLHIDTYKHGQDEMLRMVLDWLAHD